MLSRLQNLHGSHSRVGGAKVNANHLLTRGHFSTGSDLRLERDRVDER